METVAKRLYEGMFLVDSALATADWDGTLGVINTILERADAEVVCMRRWGERKLAYDIDHKGRGTYILCYFKADGLRISGIEKDVQLSEKVMRVLVLSTEGRPANVLEKELADARETAGEATESAKVAVTQDAAAVEQPAPESEEDAAPPATDEDGPDAVAAEMAPEDGEDQTAVDDAAPEEPEKTAE